MARGQVERLVGARRGVRNHPQRIGARLGSGKTVIGGPRLPAGARGSGMRSAAGTQCMAPCSIGPQGPVGHGSRTPGQGRNGTGQIAARGRAKQVTDPCAIRLDWPARTSKRSIEGTSWAAGCTRCSSSPRRASFWWRAAAAAARAPRAPWPAGARPRRPPAPPRRPRRRLRAPARRPVQRAGRPEPRWRATANRSWLPSGPTSTRARSHSSRATAARSPRTMQRSKAAEKSLCNTVIKDTVPAGERAAASSECAKL